MDIKTANRMQELRKRAGLSQEELADKLNVSRQAISKWERGEASPDTDNLIALAKLYNISIDELINGESLKENNDKASKMQNNINSISEDGKEVDDDDRNITPKQKLIISLTAGLSVSISTIVFLILGLCFNLWHPAWLVFLLIPLATSLTDGIIKKNAQHFAFPVLITIIYLIVGFLTGLWHPCWVMFLTIPIYYIIFDAIKSYKDKVKKDNINKE